MPENVPTSREDNSSMDEFSATAPAKINLGLHVLRKRADGFHDLATVFHPISWADTITISCAEAVTLTCTDQSLSTAEDNLVMRAARALQKLAGVTEGVHLHLEKEIPHGAGLGGGSSDAATTLRMLCQLWKLDAPSLALESLALQLGSDVPFFLQPCTSFAEGRGEQLTPLEDYTFPFTLAVIVNPIHISTEWAFQQVDISAVNRVNLVEVIRSNDLDRWRSELVNDFEQPIFSHVPVLRECKASLLRNGAGFAALTGSGAGVYGIFEHYEDAQQAINEASERGCTTWIDPVSGLK